MHGEQRLSLSARDFMAEVTLVPGRAGANSAILAVTDHAGQPLDVAEVTLRLSNPEKGIAPLERPAERTGPGLWSVPALILGVAGTWELELDVLISDFERQSAVAELTLR